MHSQAKPALGRTVGGRCDIQVNAVRQAGDAQRRHARAVGACNERACLNVPQLVRNSPAWALRSPPHQASWLALARRATPRPITHTLSVGVAKRTGGVLAGPNPALLWALTLKSYCTPFPYSALLKVNLRCMREEQSSAWMHCSLRPAGVHMSQSTSAKGSHCCGQGSPRPRPSSATWAFQGLGRPQACR